MPKGASTILGVEFSGHVAELGSEVSQWKINDEVFGLAAGVSPLLPMLKAPVSDSYSHQGRVC